MSSVNKVILIGNVGADPDVKLMPSGDKLVNLSVCTSEKWKDKNTGEYKEKSEWHKVCIRNKSTAQFCEDFVKRGTKVYVEGKIETRSWEQDGQKRYSTEIVVTPFDGGLQILDKKSSDQGVTTQETSVPDEIPF